VDRRLNRSNEAAFLNFSGIVWTLPEKFKMQCLEHHCGPIKQERPCLTKFLDTKKSVENTTRSGVFLTSFESG